jgi:hypothetical protein
MKNVGSQDETPCGFLIIDVSEECIASIIRVERMGELGTTLTMIRN